MALIASGRIAETSIVLESGEGQTQILGFHEGEPILTE